MFTAAINFIYIYTEWKPFLITAVNQTTRLPLYGGTF